MRMEYQMEIFMNSKQEERFIIPPIPQHSCQPKLQRAILHLQPQPQSPIASCLPVFLSQHSSRGVRVERTPSLIGQGGFTLHQVWLSLPVLEVQLK
uniref:Uncharacterized protein n=1 Tax=Arion vulgaris TaxID=1028688 RepID=A0A0B6YXC8_9EUPU